MHRGVSVKRVKPIDQATGLRNMVASQVTPPVAPCAEVEPAAALPSVRVISVSSGKGGVGKTNVVANLAVALQSRGKRILVLDADLGLGNIDVLLGLDPPYTIQHVLNGDKPLREILFPGPAGISILPASSGVEELTQLTHTQRLNLLDEVDALEESFDAMIIDTGAGISANVIYFNIAAQEKVVVANNEPTSLTDAYALIKVLYTRYQEREFKVLVNGVRHEQEAELVYRQLSTVASRFLGGPSLDYLGWIPLDHHVPLAVCQQKAVVEAFPDAPASQGFYRLAEVLWSSSRQRRMNGNIKFFWKRLLNL